MKDNSHLIKRSMQPIFKFCIIAKLLLGIAYSYAASSDIFAEYQLQLPFNVTQPIISADILPLAGKELLVVGVTDEGERQLAIFAFDSLQNMFFLIDLLTVDNSAFALDVGDVQKNGLQNVYVLSRNVIARYEYTWINANQVKPTYNGLETEKSAPIAQLTSAQASVQDSVLRDLLDVKTMYLAEQSNALLMSDFARDLNADQQDDFIIPHFEQVNFWLSQEESLSHQSLDVRSLVSVDRQSVEFKARKLAFNDMNQDGQNDIVLVENEQLLVFKLQANGLYAQEPYVIKLGKGIEGLEWWDKFDVDGQQLDQSQLHHRNVEMIADINGDGLPDLVVRFTQSSGVLDRKNDYEFFYARLDKGQLVYDTEPSTFIRSQSTLSDLKQVDLENDGQSEIMFSAFDLGVSQIISALLSSSIDQEMLIFKMDDKQQFSAKPFVNQDVEMTFSLSSGRSGEPMVKLQDVNGDGWPDLLFSDEDQQIKLMFATPDDKRAFSRRAEKFKVNVPKNAKSIVHDDVNNDGKIDLILHYSKADPSELLNKVVVLIAN